MSFYKNGIISCSTLYDKDGANILENAYKYDTTPYVVSGATSDNYIATDMYSQVTPNTVYYLLAQCSSWSDGHGYNSSRNGKGTIWLYISKTYNPDNYGYDSPVLFTSSNWLREGVWKYTMPDGYNMARVRLNTYADGTNSVTCKFSHIRLIPESYYADGVISSLKVNSSYIASNNILEI